MKNLQIGLDDAIITCLDHVASKENKTRTAVIREALDYWIKKSVVERFEKDWIASLQNEKSAYPEEDELWMASEAWEEE